VAFSSDGQTLASGGSGGWDAKQQKHFPGEVKLWDVKTGKERASLEHPGVYSVAFSRDGQTLASGGGQLKKLGTITLWDVKTGKERASFQEHGQAVRSVAFSGDGQTLASGSEDKTIKLWNVKTGQK
jgi:WD40 repeat protein